MNTAKFIEDEILVNQYDEHSRLTFWNLQPRKKFPFGPEKFIENAMKFRDNLEKHLAVVERAVRQYSVEQLFEHDIVRYVMETPYLPVSNQKRFYSPIDPVCALLNKLSSRDYDEALDNSLLIQNIFEDILLPDIKLAPERQHCDHSNVIGAISFLKYVAFEDAAGYIELDRIMVKWKSFIIRGSNRRAGYGDTFPNSFMKKKMIEENKFLRAASFYTDVMKAVAPQLLVDPIIEGPKRLDMTLETFVEDACSFNPSAKYRDRSENQLIETYFSMYAGEFPLDQFTKINLAKIKNRIVRKFLMVAIVKIHGIYRVAETPGLLPLYFAATSNTMGENGPDTFRTFFTAMRTSDIGEAKKNLDIVVQLLTELGDAADHLNFLEHLTVAFNFVYSDDDVELYELVKLVPNVKVRQGKNADDYRSKMLMNLTETNKFLDVERRKKLLFMLS